MAKKVFAVTGVKLGSGPGQTINAGDEINVAELGLTKPQLLELHAAGAIEVRDTSPETLEVEVPDDDANKDEGQDVTPPEE